MATDSNQDWCAELYERRGAGLLLYARSLGLSHSEAEDVLQETFQALLQSRCRPEQEDRYVLRTLRNRALNHRRRLLRRLRREGASELWFERATDSTGQEEAAMKTLARLPRKQREVIVLKIWHNHTFETIGELLGVSPNTVAARYRDGLQKLRTALQREEKEHEQSGTTGNRGPSGHMDTEGALPRLLGPSFQATAQTGFTT